MIPSFRPSTLADKVMRKKAAVACRWLIRNELAWLGTSGENSAGLRLRRPQLWMPAQTTTMTTVIKIWMIQTIHVPRIPL